MSPPPPHSLLGSPVLSPYEKPHLAERKVSEIDRRVSYNVRLSKDQAYHILDTYQAEVKEEGGANFVMVEEEESMGFSNINDSRYTEDGILLTSNARESKKNRKDQIKIPVLNANTIQVPKDRNFSVKSQNAR